MRRSTRDKASRAHPAPALLPPSSRLTPPPPPPLGLPGERPPLMGLEVRSSGMLACGGKPHPLWEEEEGGLFLQFLSENNSRTLGAAGRRMPARGPLEGEKKREGLGWMGSARFLCPPEKTRFWGGPLRLPHQRFCRGLDPEAWHQDICGGQFVDLAKFAAWVSGVQGGCGEKVLLTVDTCWDRLWTC